MIERAVSSDFNEVIQLINKTNREVIKSIIPKESFIDPIISRERLLEEFERSYFFKMESGTILKQLDSVLSRMVYQHTQDFLMIS